MIWPLRLPRSKADLWAGFQAGQLDYQHVDDGWGGSNHRWAPALFRNRNDARRQYQDVRKVRVTELPARKASRT